MELIGIVLLCDDIHCDVYGHHETAMCLALALINAESDCYGYGVDKRMQCMQCMQWM